ncbi:5'-nucleotidase C-terminal domain-containing protein [Cellulophaga baltica]|uniref:5'-nucleotidase C-terminal domain-containing protein n=1 Tax=Cellulophaga TaxID=104264 RepID=UPI001C0706BA|nr:MULTISPECIES: 5'-nucleotidase [Cellulophaga]MBU2996028.1 5'-nucleotidase C-terminal domain-containing protein [Cellulophaga baltica]MDO6767423.1 5'-nucleotidase [Cellulophaga sp. 1_MG-2023]
MILKIKQFVIIITLLLFSSCKQEKQTLTEITGKEIPISDTIPKVDSISNFITPYRKRINEVLDSTLAFAPTDINKAGKFNTNAGNLMADAVLELIAPVFKSRTNNNLDIALLNHGGIRSVISKGNVSARTAYEIMPFDNSVIVVGMKGKAIREMVNYLIASKKPQPFAGLQIIVDKNDSVQEVNIQGKPFDENKTYYIATSDYLLKGGDHMDFFKNNISTTDTNYLIRNVMIDYFTKKDTIAPVIDDRFIKLED